MNKRDEYLTNAARCRRLAALSRGSPISPTLLETARLWEWTAELEERDGARQAEQTPHLAKEAEPAIHPTSSQKA
jgi:hypothetical protein